jgi:hypothetical protein
MNTRAAARAVQVRIGMDAFQAENFTRKNRRVAITNQKKSMRIIANMAGENMQCRAPVPIVMHVPAKQ